MVRSDVVPAVAALLQGSHPDLRRAACTLLYRLSRVHQRFALVVAMSDAAASLASLLRCGETGEVPGQGFRIQGGRLKIRSIAAPLTSTIHCRRIGMCLTYSVVVADAGAGQPAACPGPAPPLPIAAALQASCCAPAG